MIGEDCTKLKVIDLVTEEIIYIDSRSMTLNKKSLFFIDKNLLAAEFITPQHRYGVFRIRDEKKWLYGAKFCEFDAAQFEMIFPMEQEIMSE